MTPYKQLLKHDPETGVFGDCWRTAIGCVLNLKPDDVPHFAEDGGIDGAEVVRRIERWLAGRGLARIAVPYNCELDELLLTLAVTNAGVWWILGGTSRTGCNHVVVGRDKAIVHDPSPANSGIVGPCDDGYYWVEFIAHAVIKDELRPLPSEAA